VTETGRPPVSFEWLPAERQGSWRAPLRIRFADEICAVPLADTELLNLAHYLPIGIELRPEGPLVVALLHSAAVRTSPFNEQGTWRWPYQPMALRTLPFRTERGSGNEISLEILSGMDRADLGPPLAYKADDGSDTEEFAAILKLLARIKAGSGRLAAAAERLIAADLLTPLAAVNGFVEQPFANDILVCDPGRLAALTPLRAATLAGENFSTLDLAIASHFSQRLLSDKFVRTAHRAGVGAAILHDQAMYGDATFDPAPEPIIGIDPGAGLDTSILFSIDDYLHATAGESR
jgi:hypothetical protein